MCRILIYSIVKLHILDFVFIFEMLAPPVSLWQQIFLLAFSVFGILTKLLGLLYFRALSS